MDLRQLRYFAHIVESGSLSKASRELYIAQPALSQQLAKLEDEVGKPLLNRSSKGVVPTDNGMALYHHARFILRQIDQALSVARQESGSVHGMVTVGLPSTTCAALGLPLVRRIRERYPSILLNVVEGMSGHLAQMMRMGQLDLAVLFSADAAPDASVSPLLDEELFVIVSCTSTLMPARAARIPIAKAAALPLILPTGSHGLRRRIAAEFERRSLSLHIVAEIDSLSLVMNCVHDGIGATIKPMAAILHERARGRSFRALAFADAELSRRNFVYALPPERLSAAATVVLDELRLLAHELIDAGTWSGVRRVDELRNSADRSPTARAQACPAGTEHEALAN
jgi:LysR family tcuABC transcriptional regulator